MLRTRLHPWMKARLSLLDAGERSKSMSPRSLPIDSVESGVYPSSPRRQMSFNGMQSKDITAVTDALRKIHTVIQNISGPHLPVVFTSNEIIASHPTKGLELLEYCYKIGIRGKRLKSFWDICCGKKFEKFDEDLTKLQEQKLNLGELMSRIDGIDNVVPNHTIEGLESTLTSCCGREQYFA